MKYTYKYKCISVAKKGRLEVGGIFLKYLRASKLLKWIAKATGVEVEDLREGIAIFFILS